MTNMTSDRSKDIPRRVTPKIGQCSIETPCLTCQTFGLHEHPPGPDPLGPDIGAARASADRQPTTSEHRNAASPSKQRHDYTVTQDGRIHVAVLTETEWNRDANGWMATDDLGNMTQGSGEEARDEVALRSLLRRLGLPVS